MIRRHFYFLVALVLSFGLFWAPLRVLVGMSLQNDYYSHILVIPAISLGIIYLLERKKIFLQFQTSRAGASILLAVGIALYLFARSHSPVAANGYFSLNILSIVIIWLGEFLLCYGAQAFRAAIFPLSFLLLVVPIPQFLLVKIILGLQQGSSEASYMLFRVFGVPVFQEGFIFYLPGITIRVAEECSGIRSSVALLIVCLLAGHLFLRSGWAKACLCLVAAPILILKNAVRIVVLSSLAVYLYPNILNSPLHRQGGIVFFLLALVLLSPILRLLRQSEHKPGSSRVEISPREGLADSGLT